MQKGKQMVATRYRSGNKYLRELQLHPAVEYLLQCVMVRGGGWDEEFLLLFG